MSEQPEPPYILDPAGRLERLLSSDPATIPVIILPLRPVADHPSKSLQGTPGFSQGGEWSSATECAPRNQKEASASDYESKGIARSSLMI